MVFLCLDKNSLLESPRKGQVLPVTVSCFGPPVAAPVEIYYEGTHFEYLSFTALSKGIDFPSNFYPSLKRIYSLWSFQIALKINSKTNNINNALICSRNTYGIDLMKTEGLIDSKKFPENVNENLNLVFNELVLAFGETFSSFPREIDLCY